MEIKTIFLIFGISLAAYSLVISFIGIRSKSFPSRQALVGLLAVGALLVVGTATFAVKLSSEESAEREHGENPIGTETQDPISLKISRSDAV